MEQSVIKFDESAILDSSQVGDKNAALGGLYTNLVPKGLLVPEGFAVTVSVFKQFIEDNSLTESLREVLQRLDRVEFSNLNETGAAARKLIMDAKFPHGPEQEITRAYTALFQGKNQGIAVRSSPFAANFTNPFPEGLHDSYLNIRGPLALIYAIKCCYASLYSNRAIKFREVHGVPHGSVSFAIAIQRMVRSDLSCSGTGLTTALEFAGALRLTATWGLGQNTVPGASDEYIVQKTLSGAQEGQLLRLAIGSKSKMTVYREVSAGTNSTLSVITPPELREKAVLHPAGIQELARQALLLEAYYGHPVAFEWAKDGPEGPFYIVGIHKVQDTAQAFTL